VRLDREVAAGELLQRLRERRRGHLDQEAQVAVVDPEHRNRPVDHQPHRAEHRAVAAQGDQPADPRAELVVRHRLDVVGHPPGVDRPGQHPAPMGLRPGREGGHRLRDLLGGVQDQAEGVHRCLQAHTAHPSQIRGGNR
jgi:hypothetical protein